MGKSVDLSNMGTHDKNIENKIYDFCECYAISKNKVCQLNILENMFEMDKASPKEELLNLCHKVNLSNRKS